MKSTTDRILTRLGLTTTQAARILRISPRTVEGWRQGRFPAQRPALRLLLLVARLNRV